MMGDKVVEGAGKIESGLYAADSLYEGFLRIEVGGATLRAQFSRGGGEPEVFIDQAMIDLLPDPIRARWEQRVGIVRRLA